MVYSCTINNWEIFVVIIFSLGSLKHENLYIREFPDLWYVLINKPPWMITFHAEVVKIHVLLLQFMELTLRSTCNLESVILQYNTIYM